MSPHLHMQYPGGQKLFATAHDGVLYDIASTPQGPRVRTVTLPQVPDLGTPFTIIIYGICLSHVIAPNLSEALVNTHIS